MAQNIWINITADKATATKKDGDHSHSISGGTAAAGDFTISFDNAVITTLAAYDSVARAARQRAIAAGLK